MAPRPTARAWAAASLAHAAQADATRNVGTHNTHGVRASALEAGDAGDAGEARVAAAVGEQLGVGGLLGLCAGYAARRLGRAAALAAGSELLLVQYLAARGWLTVHWRAVADDLRPRLGKGAADAAREVVLYKLPFAGAFSLGMAAGLRL